MNPAPACPRCGAPSKRIVYGYFGSKKFDATDPGNLVFGGCFVWDNAPAYRCAKGHDHGQVERFERGAK